MYEEVCFLLRKIGLSGTYVGFRYLVQATLLVLEDATYLFHLTTRLYPDVAQAFQATPARVERAMRFAIDVIWHQGNRAALEELLGYHVKDKPCVGAFVDMLAGCVGTR